MNKFKLTATSVALASAMAFSGTASADFYDATVNWSAINDIASGGVFSSRGSGTITSDTDFVINPALDHSDNDTGFRVEFTIAAHETDQTTLDGLLGAAGAGFTWVYDDTEWRGAANTLVRGQVVNNSAAVQNITGVTSETQGRLGFNGTDYDVDGGFFNPGTVLGQVISTASNSFLPGDAPEINFDPAQTFDLGTDQDAKAFANDWVVNNGTNAYARGFGTNTQSGSGNVSFEVVNRTNFNVQARYNYTKVADEVVTAPEPGMIAMLGLGMIGMTFVSRKRKNA